MKKKPRHIYDAPKRGLDILVSGVLLLLTLPIQLLIAILVRVTVGKPILFRQRRPGRNGAQFFLWKFRTMRVEVGDPALDQDSVRLTRFGKKLRESSLDELPSLFNVLRGDMSIVGPRPLLVEYLPLYSQFQNRRHEVRPGITGLAQVSGRNSLTWEERLDMDVFYVERRSFSLDARIILNTFKVVISRSGISANGHVTMPKFQGSAARDAD